MQVHLMSSDGTDDVVGVFPAQPTYKEIESAVKEVSSSLLPCCASFSIFSSMYPG
jgi:hypothetical protein